MTVFVSHAHLLLTLMLANVNTNRHGGPVPDTVVVQKQIVEVKSLIGRWTSKFPLLLLSVY